MSSRTEQLDHVVALLERFVSGEDRSKQFAGELEGELDAVFPEDARFEDVVSALAMYQPGGGDDLYDEKLMLPMVRQALELAQAERKASHGS